MIIAEATVIKTVLVAQMVQVMLVVLASLHTVLFLYLLLLHIKMTPGSGMNPPEGSSQIPWWLDCLSTSLKV